MSKQKTAQRTRLSASISPETKTQLLRLREKLHAETEVEALRRVLNIAEDVIDAHLRGIKIIYRNQNGKEETVRLLF